MKPSVLSSVTLVLLMAAAGHAGQGPRATARELYSAAVAREKALRVAADRGGASLEDYRAAVNAYDRIVRLFPTSGYVDNALWQGGGIARDAFGRYGQEHDRATARRMLSLLVSDYPASSMIPMAREALKRLDSRAAPAQQPAPQAPPRPAAPKPANGESAQAAAASSSRRTPLLPVRRLPSPWGVLPLCEAPESERLRVQTVEPQASATVSQSPANWTPKSTAPAQAPNAPPLQPATRGPVSMARQLGLGAQKIVIDPGHGGHDPGALGPGISEAEVVLDIALRLESLLTAAGVEVVLTRRTDEFVPLDKRPAVASREQADLFLSIHANASRVREARGIESYFLNFATDPGAEAVAARENAATSHTMSNLPEIVRTIALNSRLEESRDFATLIERTLVSQLRAANKSLLDHGVKQAPFVVLVGAEMPSVLVEVAFITNPQEGRLLKSGAYRQQVAQALFDAVRGYQRSLKSAAVLPVR
jgi:N-acetylmuramoyl-L-alanine amidase